MSQSTFGWSQPDLAPQDTASGLLCYRPPFPADTTHGERARVPAGSWLCCADAVALCFLSSHTSHCSASLFIRADRGQQQEGPGQAPGRQC